MIILTPEFITIIIDTGTGVICVRTEGGFVATDTLVCGRVQMELQSYMAVWALLTYLEGTTLT